MKISPKKYALALLDSLDGKSVNETSKIISNFVKILAANNDIRKADAIIVNFEDEWRRKQSILEAEIRSVRVLDQDTLKAIKDYLKKITDVKEVEIVNKTDKGVLGGVIIKYGDKVLDNSIRTRLIDLKNNLSK